MKFPTRMLGLPVAAAAASAVLLTGATAASAAPSPTTPPQTAASTTATTSPVSVPISGTFTDALGGLGQVAGTFTPTSFANQAGQLVVTGNLVATLTDSVGNVLGTVTRTVTTPVTATGTCQVLNLYLGPLHLNLLGLVVDLAPVQLNITAQQGSGNLLGNLLCAVANLLNGSGTAGSLAGLLNQILALL